MYIDNAICNVLFYISKYLLKKTNSETLHLIFFGIRLKKACFYVVFDDRIVYRYKILLKDISRYEKVLMAFITSQKGSMCSCTRPYSIIVGPFRWDLPVKGIYVFEPSRSITYIMVLIFVLSLDISDIINYVPIDNIDIIYFSTVS